MNSLLAATVSSSPFLIGFGGSAPSLPNVFPYRIPMLMSGDLMRAVLYKEVLFFLFSSSVRPGVFYSEGRNCTGLPASHLCLVLAACSSTLDSFPLAKVTILV